LCFHFFISFFFLYIKKIKKMNGFSDSTKNWTEAANKKGCGNKIKPDKNFKKHMIKPCSQIAVVGPTGSGKTNFVIDFLSRKPDAFYRIIYFSGSTSDEPLLKLLQNHIEGVEMIEGDADQLPDLTDMNEENKSHEKLIVFDDCANINGKQKSKIQKWFCASRKYGFTTIFISQDFQSIPLQIRRNVMIYIIFRMNESSTINHILRAHADGDDKDFVKILLHRATEGKGNFLKIDFSNDEAHRYSHNFLDFVRVPKNFSHRSIK